MEENTEGVVGKSSKKSIRKTGARGRPRAPSHVEVDKRAYISRMDGARSLEISRAMMRKHEEIWFKESKIKIDGVAFYPRDKFEDLRAHLAADDSSPRCMALFDKGLGPKEVVLKVRPRRASVVHKYYEEYLSLLELEQHVMVIRFDPSVDMRAWRLAHGFAADAPLHPEYVRRCVEIVSLHSSYREGALYAARMYDEREKAKRRARRRMREPS